jgi:hypothetical protein
MATVLGFPSSLGADVAVGVAVAVAWVDVAGAAVDVGLAVEELLLDSLGS